MNESYKRSTALINIAALLIILAIVQHAAAIIEPFLLVILISMICTPAVNALTARRLPRIIAVIFVVACVFFLIGLVSTIVGSSIVNLSHALPEYQDRLNTVISQATQLGSKIGFKMDSKHLFSEFDPGTVFKLATGSLVSFGEALGNSLLIAISVVFYLFEAPIFQAKIHQALVDNPQALARTNQFSKNVNRYLGVKTLTAFAVSVLVTIFLAAMRVDFPVLWGLLTFLFYYIPNIGSVIASVPPILMALLQFGFASAAWVAVGLIAIHGAISSGIEPKLMGKTLGLSTLVVFISLVFWGWLLGPIGMIVSIPLTMVIVLALETSEKTQWVADLLSG